MSKKIVYEDNQPLPLITSYLDRFSEEMLQEMGAGKGENEDGEENE